MTPCPPEPPLEAVLVITLAIVLLLDWLLPAF
jgi:hypothetical protein